MALLREVVADLDTSFVPHDASRCAIFLTITMSCDKLVSHEIQHGNMPRPYPCPCDMPGPGPGPQIMSDQTLHARHSLVPRPDGRIRIVLQSKSWAGAFEGG